MIPLGDTAWNASPCHAATSRSRQSPRRQAPSCPAAGCSRDAPIRRASGEAFRQSSCVARQVPRLLDDSYRRYSVECLAPTGRRALSTGGRCVEIDCGCGADISTGRFIGARHSRMQQTQSSIHARAIRMKDRPRERNASPCHTATSRSRQSPRRQVPSCPAAGCSRDAPIRHASGEAFRQSSCVARQVPRLLDDSSWRYSVECLAPTGRRALSTGGRYVGIDCGCGVDISTGRFVGARHSRMQHRHSGIHARAI
jgi:hypothetical protein